MTDQNQGTFRKHWTHAEVPTTVRVPSNAQSFPQAHRQETQGKQLGTSNLPPKRVDFPKGWHDCEYHPKSNLFVCKDENGNKVERSPPGTKTMSNETQPETTQLKPPVGRPTCECPKGHSCICKWN